MRRDSQSTKPAYSEEQLVLEALDNSHQAFEQLIEQYQYRVLRTIASIISDDLAAHDVAQETFLSAWSDLPKLKEKQKFGGWLNQIAVNLSKHWLRDRRKYQEHTASFKDMISLTQERRYQRDKLRHEVWEAIDELTEDYRDVVILHYISGYSYKEISEMLSIPFSTIVGRLQEARNQLRKEFLDMVTQLQLEIDSTVHKFLKEHAKQNGVSVEGLVLRLIERYKMDMDSPEIAVRKVSGQRHIWGRPSPDGRYLAMVNWDTFNLAVRDFTTGEDRDVTSDGQYRGVPHRLSWASVWSPDSRQIAHGFFNEGYYELRIVGLDGSEPRVLWSENGELLSITPYHWSSDGKFILGGANKPNDTREIVMVSAADGSMRTLKSLEGRWSRPTHHDSRMMDFSPDGSYIAYHRPVKENNGFPGIFLLATDGSGAEIPLVGYSDGFSINPVWTPDGKAIVFRSNHHDPEGATSLWFTRVVDGKQVGGPQFIMRSAGEIVPLGFTSEGSLYYGILCGDPRSDIYVAALDMETGEVISQPARLRSEGSNRNPSWSPDGKKLAYVSRRPAPENSGSKMRTVLVIRSMETGEEREILPEKSLYTGQNWAPLGDLCWSPDGRSILCGGEYTVGIHLIDIRTGGITTVVEFHPRIRLWGLAWSQDGKTVFYIRLRSEKGDWSCSIMSHDLATGQEQELYSGGRSYGPAAFSPDGRELAFLDDGYIKVMPTVGGEVREVHHKGSHYGSPVWTTDGRYLLFRKEGELCRIPADIPTGEGDIYIASIDPATGEVLEPPKKAIQQFEGFNHSPAWSPDGKSLAYVSSRPSPEGTGRREVLVIRSEETGEERELYPEVPLEGRLIWSPDGRFILCRCRHPYLIDIQTGDVAEMLQPATTDNANFAIGWSTDGKAIFCVRGKPGSYSLIAHDLKTGKEKKLSPLPAIKAAHRGAHPE